MLGRLTKDASHLYISCGTTDFRKQIDGLVAMINLQFKLDPFSDRCVFIFCNKRKNSIKVLRYDNNGFVLASKKLLDGMKFQWPKDAAEVKEITSQQLDWLLQGLSIEQKKITVPSHERPARQPGVRAEMLAGLPKEIEDFIIQCFPTLLRQLPS